MSVVLNPYLHFNGNAAEALDFYHSIFGGEVRITHFGDFPEMSVTEDQKNQVMHGVIEAKDLQLMASDSGPMGEVTGRDGLSLSLSGDDAATLTKYFEGLSQGGKITDPLNTKQWGDTFGMLVDKFGIAWMVNISKPQA